MEVCENVTYSMDTLYSYQLSIVVWKWFLSMFIQYKKQLWDVIEYE